MSQDVFLRALDSILSMPNPRIQEPQFRPYLNMLMGDESGRKVAAGNWIEVAGTALASVDVYQGQQYLFTVPPLLGASVNVVDAPTSRANNLFSVLGLWQAKQRVLPALGDAFFKEHVMPRIKEQPTDLQYALMWNKIYAHYNLKLLPIPAHLMPAGQSTTAAAEQSNVDIEDEPF